jgi:hypothetical protein
MQAVLSAVAGLGLEADPLHSASLKGAGWYDSEQLRTAHAAWSAAVSAANAAARAQLRALAARLEPCLGALAAAADFSVLMQALVLHAGHAGAAGWTLPQLEAPAGAAGGGRISEDCGPGQLVLSGFWPYWMDGREGCAVVNSVAISGMALLTGPNMAGELTLYLATP